MDDEQADRLALLGRALNHPLRVQILTQMLADGEMSPVDVSRAIDEPLANVSYHTRYLVGLRMIELHDTVPRRGAVQHFYRLSDAAQEVLPAAAALVTHPMAPRPQDPPAG